MRVALAKEQMAVEVQARLEARQKEFDGLLKNHRFDEALSMVRTDLKSWPNEEGVRNLGLQVVAKSHLAYRLILLPRMTERYWKWVGVALLLYEPTRNLVQGKIGPSPSHRFFDFAPYNYFLGPIFAYWLLAMFWAFSLTDFFLLLSPKRSWLVKPVEAAAAKYFYGSTALIVLALYAKTVVHPAELLGNMSYAIWAIAAMFMFLLRGVSDRERYIKVAHIIGACMVGAGAYALVFELIP